MSRHRNMKYITQNAYDDMEEDEYYDEGNGWDISQQELDGLVNRVYEILGNDYTYYDITWTLKEQEYDIERTIDVLLNPAEETVISNPARKKQSLKSAKKNKNTNANKKNNQKNNKINNKKNNPKKKEEIQTLNRKNSKNYENIARKMSNNEMSVNRKHSKKYVEFFDDKKYGNQSYPEITYSFNQELLKEKKNRVTIVISGHVDSGKSTLLGQIMVLMEQVDKTKLRQLQQMEERQKEQKGRCLAWIFDEREDEREKGITVDVNEKYLLLGDKFITFLDTPGHRDLVPKMISGASQCQIAMLIIDGDGNNFEKGFSQNGQTKEHAFLLNSIGPQKLFVVINKMDTSGWDEGNYNKICGDLQKFFESENMKNFGSVEFIPVSALKGENINKAPEKASWWKGPTLLEALEKLESNVEELVQKPFRMGLQASYESKEHSKKGFILSGRVEGGVVSKGMKLIIKPLEIPITIKEVYVGDNKDEAALPGDITDLIIKLEDPKQWVDIRSGLTLSSLKFHVPVTSTFEAIIYIFEVDTPILKGTRCDFHFGPLAESGILKKLKSQKNPSTLEEIKKNPRFILSKMCATVMVQLDQTMCLELESNFSSLGKFQFRDRGRTLGYGRITKII